MCRFSQSVRMLSGSALVLAMRNILIDGAAPPMSLILNLAIAASFALALGFLIFGRLKTRFYEHI